MRGNNFNPDVVVVGMPSCGKTVFFTVLGRKFTSAEPGARKGPPLGFNMSSCDDATINIVDTAFDRLREGKWPGATPSGQIMPLEWEVRTGTRHIFNLSSMDVAGEDFRKAFNVKGNDDDAGADSEAQLDPLIGPSMSGSSVTDAVDTLKKAVDGAKVVCFMVNVALSGQEMSGDVGVGKRHQFGEVARNIFITLKDRPDLRAKSMILLTQSHRHKDEIERAGGPAFYLRNICGGDAAQLSKLAREKKIPVIAVSAINVDGDSNDLPEITSAEDIQSSGLFAFMLVVSGMVAANRDLVALKDAYLTYQRERAAYLKCLDQDVRLRLEQSKKYHDASEDFVRACDSYLCDANLAEPDDDDRVSPSELETYRRCTKEDPEIKEAAKDSEIHLTRDRLWDHALRTATLLEKKGEPARSPKDIYDEVLRGMKEKFPTKEGSKKFVYGFREDEEEDAQSYFEWIKSNQEKYKACLEADINGLKESKEAAVRSIDALRSHVGGTEFEGKLKEAKRLHDVFCGEMEKFKGEWFGEVGIALAEVCPEVGNWDKEVADCSKLMDNLKGDHDRKMEERRRERQRQEAAQRRVDEQKKEEQRRAREAAERAKEEARRRADEARRQAEEVRRRKERLQKAWKFVGLWIVVPILVVCLIYQGIRYGMYRYYDGVNRETSRQIMDAISRSDYRGAWQLHGTLVTKDWLEIGRYDHLCAGFDSRLADAEELSKACAYIVARRSLLQAGDQCLAAITSSGRDVSEASRICSRALEDIGEFNRKVTGENVANPSIDLAARRKGAEERKTITDEAVGALYKAAFWSGPFFVLPSEDGKYRLGVFGSEQSCTTVELCQFAKELFDNHFFTMLQGSRPLSGYDIALMELSMQAHAAYVYSAIEQLWSGLAGTAVSLRTYCHNGLQIWDGETRQAIDAMCSRWGSEHGGVFRAMGEPLRCKSRGAGWDGFLDAIHQGTTFNIDSTESYCVEAGFVFKDDGICSVVASTIASRWRDVHDTMRNACMDRWNEMCDAMEQRLASGAGFADGEAFRSMVERWRATRDACLREYRIFHSDVPVSLLARCAYVAVDDAVPGWYSWWSDSNRKEVVEVVRNYMKATADGEMLDDLASETARHLARQCRDYVAQYREKLDGYPGVDECLEFLFRHPGDTDAAH